MNLNNKGKEKEALSFLMSCTRDMPDPLESFLNEVIHEFGDHPGGSTHHHGYRKGLLVHTAEVVMVGADMAISMGVPRSEIITAGIMHDWGKIYDYRAKKLPITLVNENGPGTEDLLIESSTLFEKVHGYQKANHIIASYDRWRIIRDNDYNDVPRHWVQQYQDFIDTVGRMILAHHGQLEWGSVINPTTPGEWCLHLADMASAGAGVVL